MHEILYIALGLVAGTFSGLLGIGGGTILIPALVFLVGMTQQQAQGTTLGIMLLPIGLLAVMRYYQAGHINLYISAFICIGFLFGGLIGANIAVGLSNLVLKRIFGIFLMMIAAYTIFSK